MLFIFLSPYISFGIFDLLLLKNLNADVFYDSLVFCL